MDILFHWKIKIIRNKVVFTIIGIGLNAIVLLAVKTGRLGNK